MRFNVRASVVVSCALALIAMPTRQAAAQSENFDAPFPAWESGWFGVNTDATNIYCPHTRGCSTRGNNGFGLWIAGTNANGHGNIVVNFLAGIAPSLTSISFFVGAYSSTNLVAYDAAGNSIFNQAVALNYVINPSSPNDLYTITSSTGISRFEFDGANAGGNTSFDGFSAVVGPSVVATPEPASVVLMVTGLAVIAGVTRRKRRVA